MSYHRISSNEYSTHGRSLNYTAPCGMKGTVGIWSPGEIVEVSTLLPEVVRIVRGRVARTVPGLFDRAVYKKGDVFYLPGNQPKVQFEALDNNDVAYECIYYQEELDDEVDATRKLIRKTMLSRQAIK